MANSIPSQVTNAPNVLLQDLGGEAILLNLKTGQYYGLNENSYYMYKVLLLFGFVRDAYEALLQEYQVDPNQLRVDLNSFIAKLLEHGLIIDANSQLK